MSSLGSSWNASTYYNRVSKLRKVAIPFSDSQSKNGRTTVVQNIVKVSLVAKDLSCPIIEQNIHPLMLNTEPAITAELVAGNVTLRFFNSADQNLIQCAMHCLGGVSRAW